MPHAWSLPRPKRKVQGPHSSILLPQWHAHLANQRINHRWANISEWPMPLSASCLPWTRYFPLLSDYRSACYTAVCTTAHLPLLWIHSVDIRKSALPLRSKSSMMHPPICSMTKNPLVVCCHLYRQQNTFFNTQSWIWLAAFTNLCGKSFSWHAQSHLNLSKFCSKSSQPTNSMTSAPVCWRSCHRWQFRRILSLQEWSWQRLDFCGSWLLTCGC